MPLFKRPVVQTGSTLPYQARYGDGTLMMVNPTAIATDANQTLTVAQISTGAIQFTGFTAGRVITTPTAALILAAAPDMDVGDSVSIIVSVVPAFAATYAAGAGVTLAGRATTPASSMSVVVITRTGAATMEWRVL
jgi:hypothetical protein